jgi:gluconolactonase
MLKLRHVALACAVAGACASPGPTSTGLGNDGGAGTGAAAGSSGAAGTTGGAGSTGVAGTTSVAGTTGSAGTTGAAGTTVVTDGGVEHPASDGPPAPAKVGPAGGACVPGATYGAPLPQVRTAKLIRGGFRELEGPVWVAAQHALYFCEAGGGGALGRIHKYTPADGKLVTFLEGIGVGGLAIDVDGKLVAATYDKLRLSRIDPATGARSDVAGSSTYMGKPFNEVNDVVVRADGNMYFSDPSYGAGAGNQDVAAFYRLSPAGVVTRLAAAKDANGVGLSPDGAWLYLGTTGGPAVQRFALNADGATVGAATTWKEAGSDGMAVDCAGNVYFTHAGVVKVVTPNDEPIGSIDGLGTSYVTNAAFGGEERKTLFITTGAALYQLELNVPGFPN